MDRDTRLVHAGRDPERQFGVVNPPIYRASTILYPTLAAYEGRRARRYTAFAYGIHGTPTTLALAELSGGAHTLIVSSGHPGHAVWKRDFRGASSLFGVLLQTGSEASVAVMVDGLRLFKIGASFGGFESLIVPASPERTARPWREPGFLLRLHVGLEAVEDLIADLEAGLARLGAALRGGAGAAR